MRITGPFHWCGVCVCMRTFGRGRDLIEIVEKNLKPLHVQASNNLKCLPVQIYMYTYMCVYILKPMFNQVSSSIILFIF